MQSPQVALNAKLIVVIDDDPLASGAMEGLLRKWGYAVLTAACDGAALAELAQRRQLPDLIVCDYHLAGGVTGIAAIRRLRRTFQIPAFLISGDAAVAESVQARDRGIRVLPKPVDASVLRIVLRQVLQEVGRKQ